MDVRSLGSATIEIPNSAIVTLTDLRIEGTVNQSNGSNLFLVGAIDNQADINVNTLGNATDIIIDNAVNLSGGGTITMSGTTMYVEFLTTPALTEY